MGSEDEFFTIGRSTRSNGRPRPRAFDSTTSTRCRSSPFISSPPRRQAAPGFLRAPPSALFFLMPAPRCFYLLFVKTDGRPMSGDTGRGATVACIRLAEKVLDTQGEEGARGVVCRAEGGEYTVWYTVGGLVRCYGVRKEVAVVVIEWFVVVGWWWWWCLLFCGCLRDLCATLTFSARPLSCASLPPLWLLCPSHPPLS